MRQCFGLQTTTFRVNSSLNSTTSVNISQRTLLNCINGLWVFVSLEHSMTAGINWSVRFQQSAQSSRDWNVAMWEWSPRLTNNAATQHAILRPKTCYLHDAKCGQQCQNAMFQQNQEWWHNNANKHTNHICSKYEAIQRQQQIYNRKLSIIYHWLGDCLADIYSKFALRLYFKSSHMHAWTAYFYK